MLGEGWQKKTFREKTKMAKEKSNLDELKKDYEKLQSKYNLPSFIISYIIWSLFEKKRRK